MAKAKVAATSPQEPLIPVSIRLPQSLHSLIFDAAQKERRAMAAEVVLRLERSFDTDEKK
jgi:hypothetical protein